MMHPIAVTPVRARTLARTLARALTLLLCAIPIGSLSIGGFTLLAPARRLDAQAGPARPPVSPRTPTPPRSATTPPTRSTLPAPPMPPMPALPPYGDVELLGLERLAGLAGQQALGADVQRALADVHVQELSRQARETVRQSADLMRASALAQVDAAGLSALVNGADLAAVGQLGDWASANRMERRVPPAPITGDDPADSLYREARKALASDSYRKAAELFRRIRDQYPKSVYTPDAPYWEAFALQRLGTQDDLRSAQLALTWQEKQFPKAATRSDASALATRVEGALARQGDKAAAQTLYGRAESASSDGCPKQNDDERVDALNALMQVDAERAVPILKKVLARREPCTQNMRRTAVWLIASRKAPDAADVLMNVAKTDPDKDVREQAVFWLSNVPTEQAADMLVELARGSGEIDLRKRALYALSRSKSPKAGATLREIASDAGAPVDLRSDALNWYMSGTAGKALDDPMGFLKDVYAKADDSRFRARVLYAVAEQRSEAAREFIIGIVQNAKESIETRRMAVGLLSTVNVTGPQLASMYERSSEVEIKRQLLDALGNVGNRRGQNAGTAPASGIDQLITIARIEKNIELRKAAIFQLSRSKDPRALALLQEIIER